MLRTKNAQKQCEVTQNDDLVPRFSLEHIKVQPVSIIKIMMNKIKTEYKGSMDEETHVQFLKIADAVVRMAEEIKE